MPRYEPEPRPYELMVLLRPDLADDRLEAALERIRNTVVEQGGTITFEKRDTPWGRRRLAYPIRKFQEAFYVLFQLICPPRMVREIERELRLNEQVLRHLIVRLDE
ncbi:30S ribosomal protein S6 [Thermomicrobium sp.]